MPDKIRIWRKLTGYARRFKRFAPNPRILREILQSNQISPPLRDKLNPNEIRDPNHLQLGYPFIIEI
ncbi:MAG: hypothetical protein JWQ71_4439 [Pedosphaera sp.]|nr:hypothetical protein [Pedosphaera sp.]